MSDSITPTSSRPQTSGSVDSASAKWDLPTVYRKLAWSLVAIVTLATIPVLQILYMTKTDQRDNAWVGGFSELPSPFWTRSVFIWDYKGQNYSEVFFFAEPPVLNHTTSVFELPLTFANSNTSSRFFRFIPSDSEPYFDLKLDAAPVDQHWLTADIEWSEWIPWRPRKHYYRREYLDSVNVTAWLQSQADGNTKFHYNIPKKYIDKEILVTLTVETTRKDTSKNPIPLNWKASATIPRSGKLKTFDYRPEQYKANHICHNQETECSYELTGLLGRSVMYAEEFVNIHYRKRVLTYVAFYTVIVVFFLSLLYALYVIWVKTTPLGALLKKKLLASTAGENEPLLGASS
ncbi:hypothetical protein HDU97_010087 [Phlyctochytrium planicorne]|nr:hypothetical protein HDU97_010087 [Phlyctochytrium planicorne]